MEKRDGGVMESERSSDVEQSGDGNAVSWLRLREGCDFRVLSLTWAPSFIEFIPLSSSL